MLLVPCPNCGPRPEIEFRCGGQAHLLRAPDPDGVDDADWAQFLFYRANTKGVLAERWNHIHGCQRWFNALRDTTSDKILASYPAGTNLPGIAPSEGPA